MESINDIRGKIYIYGDIFDPVDAKLSVFDRGFLYGDAVFETLRVYAQVPLHFADHLERLWRSAKILEFPRLLTTAELKTKVQQTLRASGLSEAYLRIIITRGKQRLGLEPQVDTQPELIIMALALPEFRETLYTAGLSASLIPTSITPTLALRSGDATASSAGESTRSLRAKSNNYLVNILALMTARTQGAREAILLASDQSVLEGSSSNVFAYIDNVWCTPPLVSGILPGITRQAIFALAEEAGIEIRERVLFPTDLQRASEIILTSSVREIVPIVQVDGCLVGTSGVVGPAYKKLKELYAASVTNYIGKHYGEWVEN